MGRRQTFDIGGSKKASIMRLITENEFNALPLSEARLHLLNYRDYLSKFPGIKNGSGHFNRVSKYLGRYDFCHSMKRAAYTVFRELSKKMSRKTKFEVSDVVYCEDSDGLLIIINPLDKRDYWCEFGFSFGAMQFLIPEKRLTLISKGDFKRNEK